MKKLSFSLTTLFFVVSSLIIIVEPACSPTNCYNYSGEHGFATGIDVHGTNVMASITVTNTSVLEFTPLCTFVTEYSITGGDLRKGNDTSFMWVVGHNTLLGVTTDSCSPHLLTGPSWYACGITYWEEDTNAFSKYIVLCTTPTLVLWWQVYTIDEATFTLISSTTLTQIATVSSSLTGIKYLPSAGLVYGYTTTKFFTFSPTTSTFAIISTITYSSFNSMSYDSHYSSLVTIAGEVANFTVYRAALDTGLNTATLGTANLYGISSLGFGGKIP